MDVPVEVIQEAEELIEDYGSNFKYLGELDGRAVWMFAFPENTYTGYPFVYLCSGDGTAMEFNGPQALDIISSLGVE